MGRGHVMPLSVVKFKHQGNVLYGQLSGHVDLIVIMNASIVC